MKRRSFVKSIAGLAAPLAIGRMATASAVITGETQLRLVVLNDLHHDSADCDSWFNRLTSKILEINPDCCILAGDLANKGLESSLVSVRDHFKQLDCPVYPVPGNHDCDVTDDTSLYEKIFPGRLNYYVERKGWQLIFLDTTDGKAWENTVISQRTLLWLKETVRELDPDKPTLVFTHFPLAEPIHMAPLNTQEVWKYLKNLNVKAAFCGHFHGQHGVVLPPLVTTNVCCARPGVRGNFDGDPRKGFWHIQADAKTGSFNYRLTQLAE